MNRCQSWGTGLRRSSAASTKREKSSTDIRTSLELGAGWTGAGATGASAGAGGSDGVGAAGGGVAGIAALARWRRQGNREARNGRGTLGRICRKRLRV